MNNETIASTVGVVDGDNIIIRQSWLNQYVLVGVTLVLEVAIIYLNMELAESGDYDISIGSLSIPTIYLPIIPLLVLARAAFKIYNERLVITPQYLIHVTGRLWWSARTARLDYNHVQEIETIQSIPQRLLGLSDLYITAIGRDSKGTITIQGLRRARAVKDLIRSLRTDHGDAATAVVSAD
jgi:membrane protein YdbS with pleckstrin-like domain